LAKYLRRAPAIEQPAERDQEDDVSPGKGGKDIAQLHRRKIERFAQRPGGDGEVDAVDVIDQHDQEEAGVNDKAFQRAPATDEG
jgi:hypothetical protein